MQRVNKNASWHWERILWAEGYTGIAGLDEVGRGAMAGPLITAAVVMPPRSHLQSRAAGRLPDLRDSKMLSRQQREMLAAAIRQEATCWAIGEASVEEIDQFGMTAAVRIAMERAVFALEPEPDFLLLDATTVDLGIAQIGLIDGDRLCASVAAASIVAKVWRDQLMTTLHESFPQYGLASHKGYCTSVHMQMVRQLGPSPCHRLTFSPVRNSLQEE